MQLIQIAGLNTTGGAKIINTEGENYTLLFPATGGGLSLPQFKTCAERYAIFKLEALADHSVTFNLYVWSKLDPTGNRAFDVRFGVMPGIPALICLDLNWLNAHTLFPEHTPGQLKVVCHGGRITKDEIDHVTFEMSPCFHDVEVKISDITLSDERPESYPLPNIKLIDELGQYKRKDWPQKANSIEDLKTRLNDAMELPDAFHAADWDEYGGWTKKKLSGGTGFFSKIKEDGKWWLLDPLGNVFFSMGPDCVVSRSDCRIDELEGFMDWLPTDDDPEYGRMYNTGRKRAKDPDYNRNPKMFSFEQANLYRAFGKDWYAQWVRLISRQFKQNGLNTLGNWSDNRLYGKAKLPYVTMLPTFPSTESMIFRDFPDVLSSEYKESAAKCAEYLTEWKDDPFMIGYFLRNEPAWAFVDGLIIADEVLYNPADTACKRELIAYLKEKYGEVSALSKAWAHDFESFESLNKPVSAASRFSDAAAADLRDFSRRMMEAYVTIPSEACRVADPHHMNLGMRWAWISDPLLISGWENFDVFSINCYAVDPTSAIDNVQKLGVDLPVMIGEFHFGALDTGLTATGLEGVSTQEERGVAYRYYCERVAAHPNGVGCHYFQCYDQFALGRFDGENYNIGLFDICSQPQEEMMAASRECAESVYAVADGTKPPYDRKPLTIPMIAY